MPVPVYPLDLTGTAGTNTILAETHQTNTSAKRFFVPTAGPFYTQTAILRNGATNALLFPGVDYKYLHLMEEAALRSSKNVCAVVYIMKSTISSVVMDYQCIGGEYSDTYDTITQLITDHPLDPDQPQQIGWGQVFGAPSQFPPAAHYTLGSEIFGLGALVEVLGNIYQAIAAGDSPAISAIYRYVELVFQNTNFVTEDQVNSLLSSPETFIKTHPTYAALKQRDTFANNLPIIYATMGKDTTSDGKGMLFRWDVDSTASPDDEHVLRPDSITGGNPGRLISMLNAENVLKKYGIDVPIFRDNPLADGVDLNTILLPGKYWVGTTQVNAIFDNSVLDVELITGSMESPSTVIQTLRGDGRVATRARITGGTWTSWTIIANRDIGSVTSRKLVSADLNDAVEPGEYTYDQNCAHIPNTYGGVLKVWRTHEFTLWQLAQSSVANKLHVRRASTPVVGGGLVWDDWETSVRESDFGAFVLDMVAYQTSIYSAFSTRDLALQRHGIYANPNLADGYPNVLSGVDLDDAKEPGEYYYTQTCTHKPPTQGEYGLMKVWRETPDIVYQFVHTSENRLYSRYFRVAIGGWTLWNKYATTDEVANAIANSNANARHTASAHGGHAGDGWVGFNYITTASDRFLYLKVVSGGGGGGNGGSTGNNFYEDAGASGGTGGSSGNMLMVKMEYLPVGTEIAVSIGPAGDVNGDASEAYMEIRLPTDVYPNWSFQARLPGGKHGNNGNSSYGEGYTPGQVGSGQPDNVSIERTSLGFQYEITRGQGSADSGTGYTHNSSAGTSGGVILPYQGVAANAGSASPGGAAVGQGQNGNSGTWLGYSGDFPHHFGRGGGGGSGSGSGAATGGSGAIGSQGGVALEVVRSIF